MFKTHNGFLQVFFLDLFHYYTENNFYSLRSQRGFQISRINITLKGKESERYFGTVIWIILKRLKQKSEDGSLM